MHEERTTGPAAPAVDRVTATRIVKTFGSTMALRGVDATLEPGRVTLIEGANGSGKTTLLGVIGTALRATSGRVEYAPLGSDPHAVRRAIGWLSHETLAYGDLTGRQNIELAARLHGLDAGDAWRRVEERFELGAFASRPLRTNSRGQRQRVALARSLVHGPSLILLDEPTAGLDISGVARLRRVIDEEVLRGAIVAVVSHEPELFRDVPKRRIVLESGRIKPDAG